MLIPEYTSSAVAPIVLPAISPPFAGYLVEEGARASGRQAEEARGINRMMSAVKGDVRKPEDIYLLDAHGAAPAAFEDVLNDSMFEPFNLAWPGIEEDKKKLDEAVNSGIVLPQYVVEERRQASERPRRRRQARRADTRFQADARGLRVHVLLPEAI